MKVTLFRKKKKGGFVMVGGRISMLFIYLYENNMHRHTRFLIENVIDFYQSISMRKRLEYHF